MLWFVHIFFFVAVYSYLPRYTLFYSQFFSFEISTSMVRQQEWCVRSLYWIESHFMQQFITDRSTFKWFFSNEWIEMNVYMCFCAYVIRFSSIPIWRRLNHLIVYSQCVNHVLQIEKNRTKVEWMDWIYSVFVMNEVGTSMNSFKQISVMWVIMRERSKLCAYGCPNGHWDVICDDTTEPHSLILFSFPLGICHAY